MNFVIEWIGKKHYKQIIFIFEDSLQKILPPKFEIRKFQFNLYVQIDNEDDKDSLHKIKILNALALDKSFDRICSIFETNIIVPKEVYKIKISEEWISTK